MTIINQYTTQVNTATPSDSGSSSSNEAMSAFNLLAGLETEEGQDAQVLMSRDQISEQGIDVDSFETELAGILMAAKENDADLQEGMKPLEMPQPINLDAQHIEGNFELGQDGLVQARSIQTGLAQTELSSLTGKLLSGLFSNTDEGTELSEKIFELVGLANTQTVGMLDNQLTDLSADGLHSNLQVYVPLSSVAIGKLSQVSGVDSLELKSSTLNNTQATQSAGNSAAQSSQSYRTFSIEKLVERSGSYSANQNAAISSSNFASVESEVKRTSSSQYASLAGQSNSEWLSKKLSLIEHQQELSVWYRDYHLDENQLSSKLTELRELFERNQQIKQIGINGKIIFARGENDVSKGEK